VLRQALSRRGFLLRSGGVLGLLGLAAACAPAAPPPAPTPAAAAPAAPTSAPAPAPKPTVAAAAAPTTAPAPTAAPTAAPAVKPAAGGDLRIDVTADPLSLDPLRFNGFSIQRVYRLIYSQLLKWNEDGTIAPDLAAAMPSVSADGLTYTFKLRTGVKWHDGTSFDAQDVKFSFDTVKTPGSASFWANGFGPIESTEAPDPTSVVVKLSRPLQMLGKFAMVPIVSHAVPYENNKTYAATGMGTGPYKFVEWVRGDRLVLERFADYFDKDRTSLSRITFRVVPENTARITNLVNGTTQLVVEAPPSQFELARQKGAVVGVARSGGIRLMFYPNFAEGRPTHDVNLRQAISWALDRQGMLDQIYPGAGVPAATYLSSGTRYFNETIGTYFGGKPDLAKARDFLQKAGGPPAQDLVIVVENAPEEVEVATIAQQNLKTIGINARVSPEDVNSYFAKFPAGDFDLLMFRSPTTTAVGFDPDYVSQGLTSTSPSNLNKFVDPKMDDLLQKALAAREGAEAQAAWDAVGAYDVQVLGQIQVLTVKNSELYSAKLANYQASGLPFLASLPYATLSA
jgi:peptide/nickel transport system substrate-binding protein